MQKRIALLYDFDYTLANGFMQEFGLMQDHGYDNVLDYFNACEEVFQDKNDIDMCLSMMGGVLQMSWKKDRKVTREYLQSFGKDVKFYPGVESWFDKINEIGKAKGYEIEHYIISSGLKEIIEGSSIYPKLKRVYANFFCYNKDGEAFWPCQVVNYTSKTQYIFRVRKNVLDELGSLNKINAKMNEEDVLPFENIIYLGDSQTDIPSFKVIKNNFARIAFEEMQVEGVAEYLAGPTAIALSTEDTNEVAKILYDFAKETPALEIKGGLIDKEKYDAAKLEAFSKLPGKKQLIAMIMSTINAPVQKLAATLQAYVDKKSEGGEAAAE